jgi:hypothetical protein
LREKRLTGQASRHALEFELQILVRLIVYANGDSTSTERLRELHNFLSADCRDHIHSW